MNSIDISIEQGIKEIYNNLSFKVIIGFNKVIKEPYKKGIIKCIHKFVNIYINLNSYKRNRLWRNINYLNVKLRNVNLNSDCKYNTKNKENFLKIIFLLYMMIYIEETTILTNNNIDSNNKFLYIKKLYSLLKSITSIVSKLYKDKIIELTELETILKTLIIFSMNSGFNDFKENNDIKNMMYFKECLDLLIIIFKEKPSEIEQKFLIDIFKYINNNICYRDKNEKNPNYTNKFYIFHNAHKTTNLIKTLNFIYNINNKDLTQIYFEFISNIYFFQYSYNNLNWDLYELFEPYLKNIKEKDYKTLLKEVSFPEFQLSLIKEILSKERKFIKNDSLIFKSAFYFSGKQANSGIISEIGKIKDHFLLTFGFNLLITNVPKNEYIVFQIKNYEQKIQIKASILNFKGEYFLSIIDSRLNLNSPCWKIQIEPNRYYSFAMLLEKGKNITISSIYNGSYQVYKIKIKEIKTSNLLLCVGCDVEKIDPKSNAIHKNYRIKNSFTGFIGDVFMINLNSYKEKFCLEKNILDLKGKYGYTLVKSLWEQKSLTEYITSNLEKTSKSISDDEPNIFKIKYGEKKKFKIIDNTDTYVNSTNFRLVDYMDYIDYMNYDNKYVQKEKLYTQVKKEKQFFNNLRTKDSVIDTKIIEIGSSLFSCNFNIIENTSGLLKFVDEDGIFYLYLIFEYYYQVLFKLSKDILSDANSENIILSNEQKEILNIIEKGIEDCVEFFLKKIIETNFNIKSYKIILFYYQMNVMIKQFLLLKNVNDNIYKLLIKFLERYQNFLKEFINTNLEDDKRFYKNQRDFFFDFLLNPAFYKKGENFDLLANLVSFLDLSNKILQLNIMNEEILTENLCEKILNLLYIFNEVDDENSEKKDDKESPSFKIIKMKYLFLLINYIKLIYSESSQYQKIISIIFNKLFSYTNEPILFYNLSLALFISKIMPSISDEYIEKIQKIFEDNYLKNEKSNEIYSISTMLLINSYYFISKQNEPDKSKKFKSWFLQLSEMESCKYFDRINKFIIRGNLDINDILEISKNYKSTDLNQNELIDKKEKEANTSNSSNSTIYQVLFVQIANISGYKNLIKNEANADSSNNVDSQEALKQRNIISKKTTRMNTKVNFEYNEQEIEKLKNNMSKEKYYNTYFTFLDDIKKRCFIYNPKNILIKRFFSHIFYRSLFYCKAFMLIKNRYLNSFPEANIENKQLDYPSKLKNFSNIMEPKLFLKKDFNIYNQRYFEISHDFLTKTPPLYEEIDEKKIENLHNLLKYNRSDINFYPHRFNINEILEEKDRYFDCELVTTQYTYYGYLILGNFYIYYGTKNEDPVDLRQKVDEIDINIITKYSFSNRDKDNKTSKKKSIILFYHDIQRIIKRRSFLMYQSFEVYCQNGKSYFFNLYRKENCENAFKVLSTIREGLASKDKFEFVNENTTEEAKKIVSEVKSGQLNNYHYLLRLNYLGSRTFNDLNQYPIFPWLFFDISKIDALLSNEKSDIGQIETIQSTSQDSPITPEPDTENNELEKLETMNDNNEDLSERLKLRNFIYPIAMQTEERRNIYEENGHSPHGTHYSTAAYVIFYFVRNYPYGEAMIQLQNYNKENPNRLFTSMGESLNVLYENQENRESVPEFFSRFDFYCNLNCAFLGIQNNGALVDDLRVNKGLDISGNLYSIYFKYEYIYRKLINSFLISKFLPTWIDYIFGIKQIEKNPNSYWIFNKASYEEKLKLDKKLAKYLKRYQNEEMTNKEIRKKINLKIDLLNNFGIVPHRVLNNSVKLRTSPKIKNLSDEILELNNNIYFVKNNESLLVLFKNPKDTDKAKKILVWNYNMNKNSKILDKKNIFSCGYLKQLQKNPIKDSTLKIPIFKPCYSMNKFIMFNKLFIVTCRYLGNFFKVQNAEYCIDVFCEDFVSCITCKKALHSSIIEDEIIYTGLKNGKLIEWYIRQSLNDYNKINVNERNSLHCHKGEITCIEIYNNQHIIITAGEDKMIFIRKTYDFELLTAIDLIYCYMNPIVSQKINIIPTLIKVSDLNCLFVLLYNYDTRKSFIRAYNFNGLFIQQNEEQNYMNICMTKNCNLLVSYYDKKEIEVLNCYDLQFSNFFINTVEFVENIKKSSQKKKKKKEKEDNDALVWNDYDYNNHELILLYQNKIVRGNIKNKEEQKNLEFY